MTASPKAPNKTRSKPESNTTPAVIEAGSVYVFEEAARRLRWRRHSQRQALRAGLKVVKFGSRRYVRGQAVLDFFAQLEEEQQVTQ